MPIVSVNFLHNAKKRVELKDVYPSGQGRETSESSDYQLWQEFKMGNEAAYSTIYKDNVRFLYSYGMKLVSDRDLVKDAIQDLFVELWDTKERLGQVRSIKSYLYKSIRRKLIAQASKSRKRFAHSCESELVRLETPSTEIHLIEKQRFDAERKKLLRTLAKLNAKQREVIHLKYYANLGYDEISEIMGLDKKGVYNLMAHTIKLLRQYLVFLCAFAFLGL